METRVKKSDNAIESSPHLDFPIKHSENTYQPPRIRNKLFFSFQQKR